MKRWLSLVGLLFVVGCAGVAGDPSDETSSALESTDYVGDQGPELFFEEPAAREAGDDVISDAAPAKKVLGFTWYGQQTGYWCGPGSTRIALSSRLGSQPSQQTLANYMGTTTAGTARINVVGALNNWLNPATRYRSIAIGDPATASERQLVKATVVNRISSGWPVVANVLSGWRPPGYPSGTIGHFVAVVGYDAGGDKVMIADPAGACAAGSRWCNVPKTYWISIQNFATWVGARGLAG